ncbi:flagellar hook-length control protein FliK [Priestia megaterium]|uniref:Flagellar hook-length control protein FliK n=1 Tax=Priestia aryabhattai TaxID=412384 RepID=A0A7W3NCZ6_PRIAR|nr:MULTISPECIES: flagellar hook-length control protein FliK [Priestia]AVX10080.1 flagellar hook-length control protein FliK [Bacillus sp. Y-01]KQU23005.1 flagellar hook-length control protein [Bacillus sp. Leaf75]MBA9040724.1 flagellar hook-length control protein FliK [Priestia aryabhattai]MBD8113063.1 flagellar hook-length control protein FliK [Priestia megaterium]MBU8584966.1 flagellar hook-length control protein FliK [Priestia megaterium]
MEISLRPAAASKVNCDEKAAASQTQGFFEEIVQQLQQLDTQPSASEEKSSDETAVDQNLLQAVGLIAIQLSEAEDKEMEPAVLYEHLTEMINRIPSSPDLEQPLLKLQHVLTDMQRAPASSETDSQEQYLSSISTLLTICKNTSSAFQTEFAQLMEELQKPQLQSVKLSDSQLQGLQKTAAEKIEKIHKQPRVLTDTLHEKRSADFFAVVQAAPKSSVRDMTAFHKEEKVPLLNQLPWKKDVVLRNESMDRDSSKKDSEISFTANTAGARLENTPSSFKSKEVPKGQEFSIDLGQVKSDHQQSDNLLNELQKIWSKASLSAEKGRSKLFIALFPKQLGTISIEVLQQENETTAQVIVSSAKTKELLDANLSTLRQVLTSQHVSVDQVDVAAVQAAPETSVKDMNAFANEEKVPQFSIDLGQVKSDHQQSTDLVNGLQKIWSKASISIEERASKLSIKLLPKQLGTISIEVLQQDHKTTAQVIVSSAKTKELLDANLFRLRQALTSQHVSVDQVGVDAVHTASESSVRNTNAFRKEEKVPFFNQLPWKKDVVLHSESIDTNSSLKNSESSAGTNTTGATVENQSSSFGTGEMPKLQQFSIYLGQAKSDYQQSSNLVNELEKIWSKASFSTEEGTSKLFIKLFPKQLGAISIEMLQKDSETVARIVVSSAKTKELLDSNLSTLRHGLASQHVSIDKIDVLLSEQAMSYNNENDQQKERQEKEAFKKEEEDQDSQQLEESASFLSSFEAALINYNV